MSGAWQFFNLSEARGLPARPLHLAIGMFDGVHLGHRTVVDAAVQNARHDGGLAGVLTFWPHPSALFRPDNPTHLIQDAATKAGVLRTLGIDVIITQPFAKDLAAIEATEFLSWLQAQLPQLAAVYVGENFRFGRGRAGDIGLLESSGRNLGVRVFSAPRVKLDGEAISSTRIRSLLAQGEMTAANLLLGYPYFATGVVTGGKRLGRTIGFPTLNLAWSPGLKPRFGVYAVSVSGAKVAQPVPGVANYGLRPTIEQTTEPRLETHVLGPCPFTEGDAITVEWHRFVRQERRFAGLDELRAQIAKDRDAVSADFSLH